MTFLSELLTYTRQTCWKGCTIEVNGIGENHNTGITEVKIFTNAAEGTCSFTDNFKGFENVGVVRRILGAQAEETLRKLMVEFTSTVRYMRVHDLDGHLMVDPSYFRSGDLFDLYLDVIHELVHVRQFFEGEISSKDVSYVERPLEIEAYQVAVQDARVLGLSEDRILDYLDSNLVNADELRQLVEKLGVKNSTDCWQ